MDKNHTEITAQRSILLAVITLTFISIARVYSPLNMCISFSPPQHNGHVTVNTPNKSEKKKRSGEKKKHLRESVSPSNFFPQLRGMKYWLDGMLFYLYKNTKHDYKTSGCVFVHNNTCVALESKTKHLQHSDCWVHHQNGCFFLFWCFSGKNTKNRVVVLKIQCILSCRQLNLE